MLRFAVCNRKFAPQQDLTNLFGATLGRHFCIYLKRLKILKAKHFWIAFIHYYATKCTLAHFLDTSGTSSSVSSSLHYACVFPCPEGWNRHDAERPLIAFPSCFRRVTDVVRSDVRVTPDTQSSLAWVWEKSIHSTVQKEPLIKVVAVGIWLLWIYSKKP